MTTELDKLIKKSIIAAKESVEKTRLSQLANQSKTELEIKLNAKIDAKVNSLILELPILIKKAISNNETTVVVFSYDSDLAFNNQVKDSLLAKLNQTSYSAVFNTINFGKTIYQIVLTIS